MNERKLDVEPIGDCGHPFRPTSVRAHNNCIPWGGKGQDFGENVVDNIVVNILTILLLPPPINVLLDPLEDSRLCVQVVDWDVKEALDLARVEVHCDYVVRSCHLV